MRGRSLLSEEEASARGLARPDFARRRQVLAETLDALADDAGQARYASIASRNLDRWRGACEHATPKGAVEVTAGDWGDVALALTRRYGECFAVLNMANASVPGGGYVEGMPAQEENMFRRSDCHLQVGPESLAPGEERYGAEMTSLISGEAGRVYLDTQRPRVCLRGAEDRDAPDLGYPWLPDDEIFPFFELRAAADDLRGGRPFAPDVMRRRIAAQLDTLREAELRFAVLGAFGCGAFQNPASEVAHLYRECIEPVRDSFALIAFAIFHAGYGPDNHAPFAATFGE